MQHPFKMVCFKQSLIQRVLHLCTCLAPVINNDLLESASRHADSSRMIFRSSITSSMSLYNCWKSSHLKHAVHKNPIFEISLLHRVGRLDSTVRAGEATIGHLTRIDTHSPTRKRLMPVDISTSAGRLAACALLQRANGPVAQPVRAHP